MNEISAGIFVSGLFFLFGIIFGGVALIIASVRNSLRKRCTVSTNAAVVELVRIRGRRSGSHGRHADTYAPVYEYEYQGRVFRRQSSVSSSKPAFSPGDIVKIYIDPDYPEKFYSPDDKTANILILVFGILGGVFAAAAVLIIVISAVKG